MNHKKQVEKGHYDFFGYMTKKRWISIWSQLDEIQRLKPESVLEIGAGAGIFKIVASSFGVRVETLDVDPELNPDYIASVISMPFCNDFYDVVCAFQMLEHLPYDQSVQAFNEMIRVSRRYVVISLPDARPVWQYKLYIPKFKAFDFLVPRPQISLPKNRFNGEHYWEVNKEGYSLDRIVSDFTVNIKLIKTYRVFENPFHRFFVFKKL